MISATSSFAIWKIYRTHVLPICIIVALLSILFGGALVVEHSLADGPEMIHLDTGTLNDIVVTNLFAASLLMMCHLIYMALMAYHLVYRFPIEKTQLIGLVYLLILFAFVAHTFHSYMEATGRQGVLAGAGWSSGVFAVAYLAMVIHGFLEKRTEKEPASIEGKRSTKMTRGQWMLLTDILVALVAILMLLRAVGVLDWSIWYPASWTASAAHFFSKCPLLVDLYTQSSPKDAIIAFALVVYLIVKKVAHQRLQAGQPGRRKAVLTIQSIDPNASGVDSLRSALPDNAVWLDLASGQGANLRELINLLYKKDSSFPKEIIFLDKNCQALMDSSTDSPQSWPSTLKRSYQHAGMCTAEGKEALSRCSIVHMGHIAYGMGTVREALHLLHFAKSGTLLLIRYTSDASFYRVISASMSCSVLRPYIYHHTHQLLLDDLHRHGWESVGKPYILPRYCDITQPEDRKAVINWCDAEYGEFSGDIIERYVEGFAADGETRLLNADRLVVLKKK